MASIAQVVSDMVESRPFLEEAIVRGIVNYSYLAEAMHPDIEAILKKPVKHYAVVMALRRLSERLEKSFVSRMPVRFKDTDVVMRSGIFEMTVPKEGSAMRNILKLYALMDFSKGDFLTITQGLYEITILSNSKHRNDVERLFKSSGKTRTIDGLSALTLRIPEEAVNAVGVFYTMIKALSWENINIVEVVSTYSELTFIIKDSDTSSAFAAVKKLVDSQKR